MDADQEDKQDVYEANVKEYWKKQQLWDRTDHQDKHSD